jgi:hypothetical protein
VGYQDFRNIFKSIKNEACEIKLIIVQWTWFPILKPLDSSVKNPLTKLNLGRKFLQSTDFCPLHIDFPSDFIMKQPVGMVAPTLTLRRWIQIFMVACKSLPTSRDSRSCELKYMACGVFHPA